MKSMKMRLLGILALSLCSVVLGDIKRVKEGDDVEFPCKYPSNYQNPRIEWTFNSGEEITLVYYNGDLTASYKNRVRYYPQGFQLKGVTRKDAGVYKCEVTDASSGNVSYMEVKTQLIVVIGSVVLGDIKRVKEGDDVEFPCKYPSNYQNPRIEWTFNSGEEITLVYYNGDLTASYKNRVRYYPQGFQLKGVTRKDAGVYKCEVTDASSGNVSYMEVKTQLIVVIGSVVIGDIKRVKEGDDVEFPCKYPSNYQNPHIEWTFNSGEEITLVYYNGDLTASYKNRVRYYPQGLQLKGVTRKDAGVYKCEVTDASSGNVNYMEVKTQLIVVIDCEQQHNP